MRLTPTEYRLLEALLSRRTCLVRRTALVELAWSPGARVSENTLDSYIARLRRALAQVRATDSIQTVRGLGYRLSSASSVADDLRRESR